jgi:hypothetical protein
MEPSGIFQARARIRKLKVMEPITINGQYWRVQLVPPPQSTSEAKSWTDDPVSDSECIVIVSRRSAPLKSPWELFKGFFHL